MVIVNNVHLSLDLQMVVKVVKLTGVMTEKCYKLMEHVYNVDYIPSHIWMEGLAILNNVQINKS